MLTRLELTNFRCFENHVVEFPLHALIVGKNNAGKSTCVEGLRLVSLVTERMRNLPIKPPPSGLDLPGRYKGFRPSLGSIFIHKECLFHRYGDPPAKVRAVFSNGSSLEVYVGDEMALHAVVFDAQGNLAITRGSIEEAQIHRVSILPQIAPLALEETRLTDDYVRANLQTLRSSLHFRNQLRLLAEYFPDFKKRVSETWRGLQVMSLELPSIMDPEGRISLLIRDGDFSAEVAWMGHGLQMWLQTIWFLCRNQDSSVLILDEPDVYMHADLQRKLIRMLISDDRQFIVATHSPEMLAEVEPDSVVVLNRYQPVSKAATSSSAVQEILHHVGSVHNLSLARIGSYKRIILVEGKDIPMLKAFQNAFDPGAAIPIDALPNSDIEGWSKWPAVLTMAKFFRKNGISDIKIYCVLDRDYHQQDEIDVRLRDAEAEAVSLTVWNAKEIENYAIHAGVVSRVLSEKSGVFVSEDCVNEAIEEFLRELKEEAIDDYSESIRIRDRSGANKSNPIARNIVEERWKEFGGGYVVSGKKLFSRVAKWCQDEHGVSISLNALIRGMLPEEVPPDISGFIRLVTKDQDSPC
jgi:AAA domain, putative AbiEii toxin, Type IV TA system